MNDGMSWSALNAAREVLARRQMQEGDPDDGVRRVRCASCADHIRLLWIRRQGRSRAGGSIPRRGGRGVGRAVPGPRGRMSRSRRARAGCSSARRWSVPAPSRTWPSRSRRARCGVASGARRPTVEDARWLRELLAEGRLPEAWIPPEHVRQWRSAAALRKALVDERTAWLAADPRDALSPRDRRLHPARSADARRPRVPRRPGAARRRAGADRGRVGDGRHARGPDRTSWNSGSPSSRAARPAARR